MPAAGADHGEDDSRAWIRFEPPLVPAGGALDRLLARALPGAVAEGIEYLDRGVVNSNYRVDLRGAPGGVTPVRLRLSRSEAGTRREAALADRLAEGALGLAPRSLAIESVTGGEAHTMSLWSWVEGETLEGVMSQGALRDADEDPLAESLAELLTRLHAVPLDPPGFGRLDGPRAARWLDDLAPRVRARLANPAHGLDGERSAAIGREFTRRITALASVESAAALVHGDLSPGNIVVRRENGRLTARALLDWEMARAADPAVDAASFRFELGEARPALAGKLVKALGDGDDWASRVDLASLPIWLDARMVARVRRSDRLAARVDAELDRFLRERRA